MADEKITVIDDKDREEEALSLCKWAAARAGVIVVVPGLGTLSTVANDIYMIMKIGSVYEEKITEKAAVSLLGSMGTVFAGGKLATLIPFAPLQIPLAIGMTYGLGRVVMEWIKAGKPKDLSPFRKGFMVSCGGADCCPEGNKQLRYEGPQFTTRDCSRDGKRLGKHFARGGQNRHRPEL